MSGFLVNLRLRGLHMRILEEVEQMYFYFKGMEVGVEIA